MTTATRGMAVWRPRRSIVVTAGGTDASDRAAVVLVESLAQLGVETRYLGREERASEIAAVVAEEQIDAVELCLSPGGGVLLLRELRRELIRVGRRDVSIVVHKAE